MVKVNDYVKMSDSTKHFLFEITAQDDKSVESLKEWICNNREFILGKIAQNGGVYFKGFDIYSAETFEALAKIIEPDLCDKHVFNGDARTWVTKYTYQVANPAIKKSLTPRAFHNEDSFTSLVPATIMFYSLEPATSGGQTMLADCRKVFNSLPEKIKSKFINKTAVSKLVLHDDVFLINSKIPKNEQAIIKTGYAYGAKEVNRISEDVTEFSFEMPLVIYDDEKNPVWFNLLHLSLRFSLQLYVDTWLAYCYMKGFLNKLKALGLIFVTFFSDLRYFLKGIISKQKSDEYRLLNNEKISILDRIKINLAFWKNAAIIPLQKGDLVILDNRLVAHARMPYQGRRELLSCMGALVSTESNSANEGFSFYSEE